MMYLQRVVNDPNDEEFVELEIIPAEIYLRENGDFNLFTVPLARNVLEVSDSSQNKQGLIDYIKVGIEEKQPPNHLFIAFYEGYQNYFISVDNSTGESVRSSSAYRIPIYRTTLFHYGSYNIGDAAFYAVYPDKETTLQLDGEHGLMEFAGDATLMYYLMEEAQEGKNAFLEKREPDFKKFPRFP